MISPLAPGHNGRDARGRFVGGNVCGKGNPLNPSPELRALIKEEAELEDRVAQLRAQKSSLDEELYRVELQSLLLALAAKSEEIRLLSGEIEQ